MDTLALLEFREAKDRFFANAEESPLDPDARRDFTTLDYFDPDPSLVFRVPVEPGDQSEVRVGTSDGAERTYRRVGKVHFEVDGEAVSLTLFSTGHSWYFLPFRDATSGRSTYGAGRYLEFEPEADGTVTLDFNYAYNPTCAYNEGYSCPLPPVENWMQVPIEAGEKNFAK